MWGDRFRSRPPAKRADCRHDAACESAQVVATLEHGTDRRADACSELHHVRGHLGVGIGLKCTARERVIAVAVEPSRDQDQLRANSRATGMMTCSSTDSQISSSAPWGTGALIV